MTTVVLNTFVMNGSIDANVDIGQQLKRVGRRQNVAHAHGGGNEEDRHVVQPPQILGLENPDTRKQRKQRRRPCR